MRIDRRRGSKGMLLEVAGSIPRDGVEGGCHASVRHSEGVDKSF